MKKEMNICRVFVWLNILEGLMLIGVGITGMFDTRIFERIHYTLLIGTLVLVGVVVARYKSAKSDEMFEYNYMKAQAFTTQAMHYVFCALMILSVVIVGLLKKADVDVNWIHVIPEGFFVLMGIQKIITGIVLGRLEAE